MPNQNKSVRGEFAYAKSALAELAQRALSHAQTLGASACDVEVTEGFGQSVTVRLGEVETIEYNRDKGVGVTVYVGQQKGHASTSDFSAKAIEDAVRAAFSIARYTAADDCAGLADPARLAHNAPDLDLCHPWALTVEEAIAQAQQCEDAARAVDVRISNSEGATVGTQCSHFIYANSNGFCDGYATSRHSISCSVIAESASGMQRDYWYSVARRAQDMQGALDVGRIAGERTVRRLDARKVATCQVPVLFEASLASGLIGHFVGAISGSSLYRKSSFLLDSLGTQVFSPIVQLSERPHLPLGLASSAFDAEGVVTVDRELVSNGVVNGYILGSYSARKLGMQSTGNAGGTHNLLLASTGENFQQLLKKMGTGLLVTELLGHGVNPVTGDYSRGAAGFWVENGVIAYPVEEITIAGNLRDMFKGIVAIGNDILVRGSKQCGSILIERMTVAGN
ncbi:MAG: metalloprotease PmbA [Neisseriaceae bacterium]|jgi:PmbA protein|nr:MAG: metalloprotease PmbA [Neisseriaceae bacterium]